jgi:hypothetical protein
MVCNGRLTCAAIVGLDLLVVVQGISNLAWAPHVGFPRTRRCRTTCVIGSKNRQIVKTILGETKACLVPTPKLPL